MKKTKYVTIIIVAVFLAVNFAWAKSNKSEVSKYQFEVKGIVCADCVKNIKASLLKVPGVKGAKVNLKESRVTVVIKRGELNAKDLIKIIEQASNNKFEYKVIWVTEKLKVEDMTCADCPPRVEAALSKIDGVKNVRVYLNSSEVIVTYNPRKVSILQIAEAVNKIGYKVSPSTKSSDINELMASLGIIAFSKETIAPDFTLKDLKGKVISLSDYRGKIVFLNFWATWCPPCRMEMPSMEELYQRFKEEDFVMLAVDLREGQNTVKAFAEKNKLNFPILLDSTGKIGDIYRTSAIPTTYLVNRQGKLIGKAIGARDWNSEEAFDLIETLLEE